jgi:hypothetical protein
MTPQQEEGGVSPTRNVPIPGWASYYCDGCQNEWDGRAEMYEGQMDPAAVDRADDCPKCGRESDDVRDWTPDYAGRDLGLAL